ncbi:MAG: hypothetical protein N3F09_02085 [Bacteroidia bacterium]|nr:hypothetical protein [Bacteroidia bacterium]
MKIRILSFLLILLSTFTIAQLEEVEKKANQLFEEEEYAEAYKLYAQLVSNQPKNALYNYRLGVCMIFCEPDKKKCFSYLNVAYKNKNELPKDVPFFLGKAYHLNYRFNEALKYYNEFKDNAPGNLVKKYQVEREIRSCVNGKQLLSEITALEILQKKQLNESDYFRSYDIKTLNGKLLLKPEEFKTSADKKKKDKSVVFVPNGSAKIFFSSYGDNTSNGKDIYYRLRLPSGDFGKPVPVSAINTPYDEDYPYLCPDGKTLYFSSKGHNSMGGYDIFKTVYDENTDTWSAPENLSFPINSPDDDYLFVPTDDGKTAYFSTSRYSPPNKIDVLKINTERKPINVAIMLANVVKEDANQSVLSKITIKNLDADTLVGKFEADAEGKLEMILPNGANLLYTVETPGLPTQSENVRIPYSNSLKYYRQTIAYENKKLRIINHFDEPKTDDNYIQYLKIIEEKAKLDPEKYVPVIVKEVKGEGAKPDVVKNTQNETPQIVEQKDNKSSANALSASKNELAKTQKNLQLIQKEMNDFKKYANDLKLSSQEKGKKADEILSAIPEDKRTDNPEVMHAIELKKQAEKEAMAALAIEKQAEELAKQKEFLAKTESLQNQRVQTMEQLLADKKPRPDLEEKLNQLDKELASLPPLDAETISKAPSSLNENLENKEQQVASKEAKLKSIERDMNSKIEDITELENQLNSTKKKKQKQQIQAQIDDAKKEYNDLKSEKSSLENELAKEKEELENLKFASEQINKAWNEDIVKNEIPPSSPSKPVPLAELDKKYSSSIKPIDLQNPSSYDDAVRELASYNNDIQNSVNALNNALTSEKNPQKSKEIKAEIGKLENQRRENIRLMEEYAKKKEVILAERSMQIKQSEYLAANLNETDLKNPSKLKQIENTLNNDDWMKNYSGNKQAGSLLPEMEKQKEKILNITRELLANANVNAGSSSDWQLKADQAIKSADSLRKIAQNAPDNQRLEIMKQANALEKEALNFQIKSYEAKASENDALLSKLQTDFDNLILNSKDENEKSEMNNRWNEIKNNLRQYQELMQESKSAPNNAARLGSLENALEKQQLALEKQQEIVKSLSSKYPDVTLTSASGTSQNDSEKANQLNTEIRQYNTLKNQALEKIITSQKQEISKLENSASLSSSVGDAREKQLLDKINANKEKAKNLESQLTTSSESEKANIAISLAALQQDIINDYSQLNTHRRIQPEKQWLASAVNNRNNLVAANNRNNRPRQNNIPNNSRNENALAANNPPRNNNNTASPQNNNTPANNPPRENNTPLPASFETKEVIYSVEVSASNNKDTTVASIQNFLQSNNVTLSNPNAESRKNLALENLQRMQEEIKMIYAEASSNTQASSNEQESISEAEIKSKSEQLENEAENIAKELSELRKSNAPASQISAKEQEYNSKKAEASTLRYQVYAASDKAYMNAITQGMERLKIQNHPSLQEAQSLMDEIENKRKKNREIREEANALSGNARWGAISNAEESESETLLLEIKLMNMLRNVYEDLPYSPPKFTNIASSSANLSSAQKETIEKKEAQQASELLSLVNAYILNLESFKPDTRRFNNEQAQRWLDIQKRKNLILELARKANENSDIKGKTKWLSTAVKEAVTMTKDVNALQQTMGIALANNTLRNQRENNTPPARENNNRNNENNLAANAPRAPRENNTPPVRENRNNAPTRNEGTNVREERANVPVAGTQRVFVTDGMEILNRPAYSDAKPIPIDEPAPPGLIFRVQLGAFKTRLPNTAFRGLSPVSGETTPNGFIRYTAGNFRQLEVATGVKRELNQNGYPDAFVVAYFNGKRISLPEALRILENEGKQPDLSKAQSIKINADVRPEISIAAAPPPQEAENDRVVVTGELERTKKLLYTVQIGVYSRQISKARLKNLEPIYTEKLPTGLYRYTAGIYNQDKKVIADKNRVIEIGINDAFVSAYLEGKRVNFNEIRQKIAEGNAQFEFEPENPIRFPGGVTSTPNTSTENENTPPPDVTPYKNNVTSYPEATPENGIKTNEEGICFKVQIGAYSRQVPQDVVLKYNQIKNWPVEYKYINRLFIYNVGNFSDKQNAQKLKDEMVNLGIVDAFITVYKDGKKLFGEEANQYLRGN